MQRFGGISRYFVELMRNFDADSQVKWDMAITYSDNEYLQVLPRFEGRLVSRVKPDAAYRQFLGGMQFRGKHYLYSLKKKLNRDLSPEDEARTNKEQSIKLLREGDFDIFHPTYYDDYFLEHLGGKPYVLSVYDLIHQIFPEIGMYERLDKNHRLLNGAQKILAISESTKADLVNLFNIPEEKVEVTLLGNSMEPSQLSVSEKFAQALPANYLLHIGGRSGYKNFLFFIQIFASLANTYSDLQVVCTGAAFDESELYLFNKLGVANRIHHIYVTDEELTYLYKNATAFVFPSMYEGFGLPVLEAFSCGCPVIMSNTSSLAEIGGSSAVYFEPKNPASMKSAISSVLSNTSFREEKVQQGYRQLEKFSWSDTAEKTKLVYAEVQKGRS